jgi:E3 ubiquitin-protein ligase DOA10
MMQCQNCEFFRRGPGGEVSFACDPFGTIKEPECLVKWQLIKINQMVASYQATLSYYRKLAPMQEKMFKVMERELNDMNESEKWRVAEEEHEEDEGPEEESEERPK